jgi:hypothetical protein
VGATDEDVDAALAGDGLIAVPDLIATRAITIHAPADLVWHWIAQLGQALVIRGGIPKGRSPARTTAPEPGSCGSEATGQRGWWCVSAMPTRGAGHRSLSSQFRSSAS